MKTNPKTKLSLLFCLTLTACLVCLFGNCRSVKVIEVKDGDTITAVSNGIPIVVRLKGIDAPEITGPHITHTQPFGPEAAARLLELVGGKTVYLKGKTRGFYGRLLGTLYLDGVDINLQMIREGLAECYPRRGKKNRYRIAEERAKAARSGMWSQVNPISPKNWRKQSKKVAKNS